MERNTESWNHFNPVEIRRKRGEYAGIGVAIQVIAGEAFLYRTNS